MYKSLRPLKVFRDEEEYFEEEEQGEEENCLEEGQEEEFSKIKDTDEEYLVSYQYEDTI